MFCYISSFSWSSTWSCDKCYSQLFVLVLQSLHKLQQLGRFTLCSISKYSRLKVKLLKISQHISLNAPALELSLQWLSEISHSFGLGSQCAYKHRSVLILIDPTFVLFPYLNSTRILAHSEINSICGKYSRKYGRSWLRAKVEVHIYLGQLVYAGKGTSIQRECNNRLPPNTRSVHPIHTHS